MNNWRVALRRLICRLTDHVDPGVGDGLVHCPRCGDLFDVDVERDVRALMNEW